MSLMRSAILLLALLPCLGHAGLLPSSGIDTVHWGDSLSRLKAKHPDLVAFRTDGVQVAQYQDKVFGIPANVSATLVDDRVVGASIDFGIARLDEMDRVGVVPAERKKAPEIRGPLCCVGSRIKWKPTRLILLRFFNLGL